MSEMNCTYCGSSNHTLKFCPKTFSGQINRKNLKCSYCGSDKHTVKACPKTHTGSSNLAWNINEIKNDYIKD